MIKAIDAQQVIMQIEHAAKVQQQHPEVQQRYMQVQTLEERKLMQERVRNAEETDKARIRGDEKKEHQRNEGGTPEKGKDDTHRSGQEGPREMNQAEGHINITV